ncbi:uncharacterized protein LOC132631129 [Lycium barbarum]|uniref:uncharacterized protein LOC132631129 n=1 Tax=Lycium barbarum TaxID=112863 RepID=UPI00293ED436|nr:uncharacterized protein LOC132631129 [Lycium barbarum]
MRGDVVNEDSVGIEDPGGGGLHSAQPTAENAIRLHDIVSHYAGNIDSHLEDKENCHINEDDLEESVEQKLEQVLKAVLLHGGMAGLGMIVYLKDWTKCSLTHIFNNGLVTLKWSIYQGLDLIMPYFLSLWKIKIVKGALSAWSRLAFGDIFKQLIIKEDIVRIKEQLFEDDPSAENRVVLQLAQAELKKYLHYEEEFWRQKAGYTWFSEGDRNTRFFHNLVNGRRKRLQVNRIQISDGEWIEDKEQLAAEEVDFFQQQFTQEKGALDFGMLMHIPQMVSSESNDLLCAFPSLEEVKSAVFELKGESAYGPDGLSGTFFHSCWDIVGMDVFRMVQALYEGHTLPKSVTHTNLVLIPKKSEVHTFGDLRLISLSNFINKVISRVVHGRLDKILPSLISSNQSSFVKGRSIIENVLLTQEIVTDIRNRGKPANVVIKLDMDKAYDRVSWLYLTRVLRRMGFAENFMDQIWRLLANNWYSVLSNGQSYGFFHFTRGVKQGDPLSPALFILSAEVFSRALNFLFQHDQYKCFGMPKWSVNLNHLAYADDNIIFASADKLSLELTMKVLRDYEKLSGQLINREKSFFYMHQKSAIQLCQEVEKRKVYYNDLIKRVKDRLQNWKERLLSFGGKAVLINSVLQSMPMYLLSAMAPTKYTLNELHKIFARFYWSNKEEGKSRHWSAWLKVCVPKQEGGLGFRSLLDVSKTLFTKLWWRFRTSSTLWSTFMWNKYCKKHFPARVEWKGGSQLWKKMLESRDAIEGEIWWEPRNGSANIWFENWTKLGPLSQLMPANFPMDDIIQEVVDVMENGTWNYQTSQQIVPEDIVDHIRKEMHIETPSENMDKAWWMLTSSGKYTKLPVDDVLAKMGIAIVSTYRCCSQPHQETMNHMFVTGRYAADMEDVLSSSRGNLGPSASAFCVRNHEGEFIHATASRIADTTCLCAEAKAMHDGIIFCVTQQHLPLILETDSLGLMKIAEGEWEVP